ncbi:MAG: hypothetical protein DRJ51_05295 [Thermoprotei archaeon]|nr:MAG: hypothetical protein DRJ51_05295 [Thermoprotei archaeon]
MEQFEQMLNRVKRRLQQEIGDDLHSIVVYGSGSRLEDFSEIYSDLNILVIVSKKPEKFAHFTLIEEFRRPSLNLAFFTPQEFEFLLSDGHPLAYLALYDGRVLFDDGLISKYLEERPKPGLKTSNYLKSYSLTWFSIALENYFKGYWLDVPNYLYKAIRDAVRSLAVKSMNSIPSSDQEIISSISSLISAGDKARDIVSLFSTLKRFRLRARPSRLGVQVLLLKALDALSELYGVKPCNLRLLYDRLRTKGIIEIRVLISEKRMCVKLRYFDPHTGEELEELL